MNGLIGEYTHKLDTKSRVSLPSKIRSVIGESVVITRGLDGCAYVYPTNAWETITTQLGTLSFGSASARAFNRFILSSATEVTIDKAGRVLIPENLRDHTGIQSEVVIAGVGNRLELWEPMAWQKQQNAITVSVDELAEGLSDIGML